MEGFSTRDVLHQRIDEFAGAVLQLFGALSREVEAGSESRIERAGFVEKALENLGRKNDEVKVAVRKLVEQQNFERKLREMHARIYEADARILGFCKKLGELQEALYDSLAKPYSDHPSRNLSGKVDKQKFSVHQVTVMAERLGLMSAPPDYAEREGLVLLKPPAPQEELLSASILHKPLDLIIQESENEMLTLQREISAVDATTHNIPSPEDRKMKESLLSKFSEKLDALDSDEEDIDQELSPEALASLWSQLK